MVTLVPLSREWFGKNNSRQLHTRYHPRKRMIQYTQTSVMNRKAAVDAPLSRGMTVSASISKRLY